MAKTTMKQYEKGSKDKAMDKKMGYKEGSSQDAKLDMAGLAAILKKRPKMKMRKRA